MGCCHVVAFLVSAAAVVMRPCYVPAVSVIITASLLATSAGGISASATTRARRACRGVRRRLSRPKSAAAALANALWSIASFGINLAHILSAVARCVCPTALALASVSSVWLQPPTPYPASMYPHVRRLWVLRLACLPVHWAASIACALLAALACALARLCWLVFSFAIRQISPFVALWCAPAPLASPALLVVLHYLGLPCPHPQPRCYVPPHVRRLLWVLSMACLPVQYAAVFIYATLAPREAAAVARVCRAATAGVIHMASSLAAPWCACLLALANFALLGRICIASASSSPHPQSRLYVPSRAQAAVGPEPGGHAGPLGDQSCASKEPAGYRLGPPARSRRQLGGPLRSPSPSPSQRWRSWLAWWAAAGGCPRASLAQRRSTCPRWVLGGVQGCTDWLCCA